MKTTQITIGDFEVDYARIIVHILRFQFIR